MDFNTSKITPVTISPQPIATGSKQFKAGSHMVSGAGMLPQPVRARLSALSQSYGLPVDLGNVGLVDSNPENIKALRNLADMARANSRLLPELMKLTSQLMKADIKQAEFMARLNDAALKHGEKIDAATAAIFSRFAQSQAKSAKLEHRTNTRNQLLEQRSAAYQAYYSKSVYGNESALIDIEYQLKSQDSQTLADSKQHRLKSASERKQKLQAYLDSEF
jgi:predicted fused transcriptional regulator/phosphomethylpyrimidine kinase